MARLPVKYQAACAVLLGVVIGILTNVISDRWSWSAAAGLTVAVALNIAVVVHEARPSTTVRQTVTGNSHATGTEIHAGPGARVTQHLSGGSRAQDTRIDVTDAEAIQRVADRGTATDTRIDAGPRP